MTDIIPAFCVGLTQVSIGHPFDTTKVLMQNNKKWFHAGSFFEFETPILPRS